MLSLRALTVAIFALAAVSGLEAVPAYAGSVRTWKHENADGESGLVMGGVTVNGRKVCKIERRIEPDGVAMRYRLPKGRRLVSGEDTAWKMPLDAVCWYQEDPGVYECPYVRNAVRDIPIGTKANLPITFRLADGTYRLITEANLVDYTDLAVEYVGDGRFRAFYHAEKGKPFEQTGADTTPWRLTIVARDLNALVNSDLVRRLCPPPANAKSAVLHRPGRCIWQWLPSGDPKYTEQKEWYDRTKSLGFEYYLIDDGWKNWRDGEKDQWACLKSAIDYGKSVGVKTAMWVDSKEMPDGRSRRAYLEKVVAAGAVGIKIDFIPRCDAKWCKWYEETLADTAELGLFVDFHGAVKPTGRERTWPHELAREAIRGHEWHITRYNRVLPPEHDTILPFCRLVQGHGDYTPVVFEKSQLIRFTWPRQLAQGVVMACPFLCYGDYPKNYQENPMLEILKVMPSEYDETVVFPGSGIGECVAMARRKGGRWFIAVENGEFARSLDIQFGFLGAGVWKLVGFKDDPTGRLDACVRGERLVRSSDSLVIPVRSCGGYVAMLERSSSASVSQPRTFCNPMSIPDMPVGIECLKFNDGDVLDKAKMPSWAYAMWQGDRGDGVKIAHQFRELADPEIHVWDGVWYLYPSCGLMWRSRDCGGTWEHVSLEERNPNYAPTVTRFRGKYYLAESHVKRGLLVSDSPTGPFRSLGHFDMKSFVSEADPEINFGDPALFADGDRLYIYLGCVARQQCLWGAELNPENPVKALRPAKRMVWLDPKERPWMRGPLEGAYVFKRGKTYYFTHAGGHPKSGSYSTFVWKGPTPLGPFAPQTNNPVFTRPDGCARGGGHGGIFRDASGDWWTTYTIWPDGAKFHTFERFIGMDRISFDENGDVVSGAPTDEPQWLPSTGRKGTTGWKTLKVRTMAQKAADGKLRTYEDFAAVPGSMEFDFGRVSELRAFRIIWCDLGLDVHRGVMGGAYRYRIERRLDGRWSVWYDASRNDMDLTVDYREAPETRGDAVRLTVLEAPRGIMPAVTQFTVFGF